MWMLVGLDVKLGVICLRVEWCVGSAVGECVCGCGVCVVGERRGGRSGYMHMRCFCGFGQTRELTNTFLGWIVVIKSGPRGH